MTGKPPAHDTNVCIEGLAHDGRGVARRAGKAVFVPGALPGEDVCIRIVRSRSSHDEATLVSINNPSPDRVEPPCPHAGACGGCTLQHFSPSAQLRAQQQRLADALTRIGKVSPAHWMESVSADPWAYRSRARLSVAQDGRSGRVRVGFLREDSAQVEDVEHCAVLVPALAHLPALIRDALSALEGPVLPEEVWLASGDDGSAVAFCSRRTLSAADRGRLTALGRSLGLLTGFGTLEPGGRRHWESPAPRLRYAPETGITLAFAPWDFTQANRVVNRALVSRVIDLLAPGPEDGVLDFFCGIGNFTLPLARRAGRVMGLESNAEQVACAIENASANRLPGCEFRVIDLFGEDAIRALPKKGFGLAVVDPPRGGAAVLCAGLRKFDLRRIAYVSCDAATLARDARQLCAHGFRLERAGVLQMFPHTSHVESLALFVR